jgi:hypothetical protein
MASFLRSVPGDLPHQGDDHLEAMLSGHPLLDNAEAGLRRVSGLLATLREAPMGRLERRGQAKVLDEFRTTFASLYPGRQPHRRPAMTSTSLRVKLGTALAAGAVGLGAVGAAALTGNMPFVHDKATAPAPDHKSSADQSKTADAKDKADKKGKAADSTKTAVGPDAAGPAAFGLCTSWAHVATKGQVAEKSVAFRNVAAAAKGASQSITAYCLTVTKAHVAGKSATHPTAKPSSHPTGNSSSHPTGNSSSHPTGNSSSYPTGNSSSHPTGQ